MKFELALALLKTADYAYFAMHREGKETYVYRFKDCFFEATPNYFNFYRAGTDDMNAEDWMVVSRNSVPVYVESHLPLEPTPHLDNSVEMDIPTGNADTEDKKDEEETESTDSECSECKQCCGKCDGGCKCHKKVRANEEASEFVKQLIEELTKDSMLLHCPTSSGKNKPRWDVIDWSKMPYGKFYPNGDYRNGSVDCFTKKNVPSDGGLKVFWT